MWERQWHVYTAVEDPWLPNSQRFCQAMTISSSKRLGSNVLLKLCCKDEAEYYFDQSSMPPPSLPSPETGTSGNFPGIFPECTRRRKSIKLDWFTSSKRYSTSRFNQSINQSLKLIKFPVSHPLKSPFNSKCNILPLLFPSSRLSPSLHQLQLLWKSKPESYWLRIQKQDLPLGKPALIWQNDGVAAVLAPTVKRPAGTATTGLASVFTPWTNARDVSTYEMSGSCKVICIQYKC